MEKSTYKKMSDNEDSFWWYVARRKILHKTITGLKLGTDNILEIGSGTGGNVAFLEKLGKYKGLEKEPIALQFSRQKHKNTAFIQSDIPNSLDEINEKYDLIALFDVIEHIEDDLTTLKKLKTLLNENGTIIISAPAHPFLWSYHDVTHQHFRRYSLKSLRALAKKSGLRIKYHSYFNCFLFPIIILLRFYHKFKNDRITDDKPVSRFTNLFLKAIFSFESKLLPKIRLPFGVSHLIILKK